MESTTVFARLLHAQKPVLKVARWCLLACLIALSAVTIRTLVAALRPPLLYQRDLLQEYVLGKAAWDGVNPYQPLPELARRYLPEVDVPLLPHATPHPPPVVLLSLPLALMPYGTANILWTVAELAAICGVWWMLSRLFGLGLRARGVLFAAFLTLGWHPFLQELIYGQLMVFALLLVVGAVLARHRSRTLVAGALLGGALALKLLGLPILLYWALKREWRSVAAALGAAGLLNLAAAVVLGPAVVVDYYLAAGVGVSSHYQAFAFNYSPWTLGWRLFVGTGSDVLVSVTAPPLAALPGLAPVASLLAMLLLLAGGLWLALRARESGVSHMVLLCLSVLTTPVTWVHYFTWALPPLVLLGKQLHRRGLPVALTALGLLVVLALALPAHLITGAVCAFSLNPACPDAQVPFLASVITLLQPLSVIGLAGLLAAQE